MATYEQQALFAYVRDLRDAATIARVESLERELAQLKGIVHELTQRRGPGRPRKENGKA